ncbi:hypothetical protein [Luteolibacter sp. LG18]|uniref:hypothetical protein n=1 Tax=Luteolibacter sp. LG18 TaxID=2819286 RepID=UPI002B280322|nr:hypothetical protein llg_14540 [Luteolibacter sp. LG18]
MIAFTSLQQELARQVREARVDHEAFAMPLKICELAECRATCCHDGVFLEPEEREIIGEVIGSHADQLARYGWEAPEIFQRLPDGRWKSVTLPDDAPAAAFPAHFPKTRCVFLDAEHRCVLQRLAMDEGRHPWFWKPVSCWMHPVILKPGRRGERPVLTLATPDHDPAAHPGYPGFSAFTPCGMSCGGGPPARQTLRAELELLGELADREVTGELDAVAADVT